jgi:hypothetical protein
MKYVIMLVFTFLAIAQDKPEQVAGQAMFKGQDHSVIGWGKLDPIDWLNFQKWKDDREFRDHYPEWEILKRIERHKELAGRILACYGGCQIFRGENEYRVKYRSEVRESDEVTTGENSFAWIFLLDGTIIRLGPKSSVSINEINFLDNKTFVFARLNQGNILWLSRTQSKVKPQKARETDVLFFPLRLFEANPYTRSADISLEQYLFGDTTVVDAQYQSLNQLIEENNKWLNKETELFLTMPLGSIEGKNLSLEAYSSIGQENYFKLRSGELLGLEESESIEAQINLRGYTNKEKESLTTDTWYKISPPARTLETVEASKEMRFNEFITRRIPSIKVARELMLKKYSTFLGEKWGVEELAKKYGYRRWNEAELKKRVDFLFEYTRNLETSNMVVAQRYRKLVLEKYGEADDEVIREEFYTLPLAKYIRRGEVEKENFFSPRLNSEKKKLWMVLHGYRPKSFDDSSFSKSAPQGTPGVDESSSDDSSF